MTRPLRIAIAGVGNVGAGTVKLLQTHGQDLARLCGRAIEILAVSARDRKRGRGIDLSSYAWHEDCAALAELPDIDVVVELIGGAEGAARRLVEAALARGKHVVTANKALLAHHGTALARAA